MYNYTAKLVTPEVAAKKAVRSGDWVEVGFSAGFPELMDRALAGRRDELHDVRIRGGNLSVKRMETVECDPEQKAFTYYSVHFGAYERSLFKRGLCRYMPEMLRLLPYMYRQTLRVDVAFVPVSAPDEDGYCSYGIAPYCWPTIIEKARTVVFEINERYPMMKGAAGDCRVHISRADYIVEGEHAPLPTVTYKEPGETELAIAQNVLKEIPDGACLALGVGGVPYTVARMLAQSDLHDLGCHTGSISDAFLEIYKAGKLTGLRKDIDRGLASFNLVSGTQEMYDWVAANPELFRPGDLDYIHSPERMGQIRNFISINGGVQLDLMGQEDADMSGTRQLSGIGGQTDFLEGAFRSAGGKGFICMTSTHKNKDGSLSSNIVPAIAAGTAVSGPRALISYVATEYGVVQLSGLTMKERAEAMISVAHPQFRDELRAYAQKNLNY